MDKNKILDAAAKLVAKGAYDKAIKEYTKVLDADPKDVRVLHKLGELYEKKNDTAQAANFFTRVADSYASDGFSMKAIALYKKVLKLDPTLIEVNLKLAELHQQHQLMSESMAYYQAVANHYDKSGNVRASLDILKKMVDLDPENVTSRIKLAELYARENLNAEAAAEFRRASEYLKRHNRIDDFLRVGERLASLEPSNLELSRELASQYLGRGDQKRALAKLQVCFKADPRDLETLNLLAQAFQGLGQTAKTVSVYKELARVYSESNRHDEASRIWAKVSQLDPADPDLQARSAQQRPAPAPVPDPAPSLVAPPSRPTAPAPVAAPARVAPPATSSVGGLSREQLTKLLTETDVYVKYGLHDKALEHLRKVFSVDPENLDAHEKAYQIYVAANNAQAASEQLLNVLRLCTRGEEIQRAQPYLATILQQNPHHLEVPAFLQVLRTAGTVVPASTVQDDGLAEDAILVESSDEEIIVSDEPEDALASHHDLALEAAADDDDEVIAEDVIDEPSVILASNEIVDDPSFAAVIDDEPLTMAEDEPLGVVDEELVVDEPALAIEPALELEEAVDEEAWDDATYAPTDDPTMVPVEVDVDYESPDSAYDAAPQQPEITWSTEAPADSTETEEEEPAGEECDEAAFFLDQGLLEEAREIIETVLIAFPDHPRAALLMQRLEFLEAGGSDEAPAPDVDAGGYEEPAQSFEAGDEGRDAFDLAAELADDFGDLGGVEEAPTTSGSDDYQVSVEEVFSEFKKGLEKIVKPEDVDTHYDLGIAYKEMGLIDDAIGEFEVARQGCAGKKRELDCLTMIGLLQMQKGDATNAVEAFKKALATEFAAPPETAKALRFELAAAWESAGSPGRALFHLQAVSALDASYRDVAANLQRLASYATPEEDPLPNVEGATANAPPLPARAPKPRTNKVGYL